MILSVLLSLNFAFAGLGEPKSSVMNDRDRIDAKVIVSHQQYDNYSIDEILIGKNKIKEFISLSGTVFAIAWTGKAHPDLSKLLGSYWGEYSQSVKNQSTHHRTQGKTQTNNIVVEKSGHMRALTGRAYIPSLLPLGIAVDEIK